MIYFLIAWAALTFIGVAALSVLNYIHDKENPNMFKVLWGLFWDYKRYKIWVLLILFTPFSVVLAVWVPRYERKKRRGECERQQGQRYSLKGD